MGTKGDKLLTVKTWITWGSGGGGGVVLLTLEMGTKGDTHYMISFGTKGDKLWNMGTKGDKQ